VNIQKGIHLTLKNEAKHEQTKLVRRASRMVKIMVTYSKMCVMESVGEVVRKMTYDTRYGYVQIDEGRNAGMGSVT